MTWLTLFVTVFASLLAFLTTPSRALCVYCASLVLYPQALTLQIGSIDLTLGRVCIVAVLANAVVRGERHRSFQLAWADLFLLASWALGLVALLQTFPAIAVERHAGAFFDTMLPYLAARMIVTSERELTAVVKGLAVIAVPVVVLALYQMLSGRNPIGFLSEHYAFGLAGNRAEHEQIRLGLHRAAVTFTHAISLGLFCAMVATLTLALWMRRTWARPVIAALIACAGVGLFTSLSSGPLLALAAAALVFLVYAEWRLATALGCLAVASVVSISAYSGERYDEVLSDFAYSPTTAQFRLDLIREALGGGMHGHWWTGYGYVGIGPGTDNTHFHWRHKDLVNFYVALLVRTGLLGLIPFLIATVLYYARLVRAVLRAETPQTAWLAWCLLAAMAGWSIALMTVDALTPILQLLYVLMAMAWNMPTIVSVKVPRAS
jgi:hypothetical protein